MPSENSVFQVKQYGHCQGQVVLNVTHWAFDPVPAAPVVDAVLDELADELGTRWSTNFLPLQSSEYVMEITRVTELVTSVVPLNPADPVEFNLGYVTENADQFGSTTAPGADGLPLINTANIIIRSTVAGKRFTGRIKVSPIREASTAENYLLGANRDAFDDAAEAYFADFAPVADPTVTLVAGVLSKAHARGLPNLSVARLSWREAVAFFTQPIIGMLQSRKVRLG